MVTTGDTGTVTNTMLAGSIANAKLTNSSVTVGSTSIALGATSTTLDGVNIGATTPGTGAFTTLSASSTVSGTGFSNYLASPPAIGGTAAAAGTFTTLSGTTSVTTPIVKSASSLTLQTNGTTTAVTVDTSQNVGIGTTSPSCRLNPTCSGTGTQEIIAFGMSNSTSGYSNYGRIRIGAESSTTGSEKGNVQFDAKYLGIYEEFLAYITQDRRLVFSTAGSERMRIDSSGKVGIGTTSPSVNLEVAGSSGQNIYVTYNSGSQLRLKSDSGDSGVGTTGATPLLFLVSNGEKARIDTSGNVMVNTTSAINGKLSVYGGGPDAFWAKNDTATSSTVGVWNTATSGNNVFMTLGTEGSFTQRGSISYNRGGGLVLYNTTSDYRAKTVNGPVENALAKVALLKPATGRMNGASIDIEFFIAHELQEVVPSAVIGEKDAVNEDGSPAYQMVDKSAIIPLLTAAIQELTARVAALEAK
jgi:hypothetical protein